MTEKSEDQVWVCDSCKFVAYAKHEFPETETCALCFNPLVTYIPQSKYLALQSDLALAVEALREIKECGSKTVPQTFPWYISRMIGIAKEALGKIGGGK